MWYLKLLFASICFQMCNAMFRHLHVYVICLCLWICWGVLCWRTCWSPSQICLELYSLQSIRAFCRPSTVFSKPLQKGAKIGRRFWASRVLEVPSRSISYTLGPSRPSRMVLVGGLVAINCLFSQKYWECHHPNSRSHIFQRGGEKPPTRQILWQMRTRSYDKKYEVFCANGRSPSHHGFQD